MLENTRIRQLAHQYLTGTGDDCIINFARAVIEEDSGKVEWTDDHGCKHTVPVQGAANLLKEYFDAWPCGLEEIESSIKQFRERAEAAEAKLAERSAQEEADAARYRWLRAQQWNDADMFVVVGSKSKVRLGTDCPCLERLDDAIDTALSAQANQGEKA